MSDTSSEFKVVDAPREAGGSQATASAARAPADKFGDNRGDNRSRQIVAVAAGLAVYLGLVLALHFLGKLALPRGGGLYPLWYTGIELLLKALIAVVPGFAAGWVSRSRGLGTGALVGAIGGVLEVVLISALTGSLFDAYAKRIALTSVATALGAALTNALAGSAGRSLRARLKPSSSTGEAAASTTLPAVPVRRRRRRKLYAS